MLKSYAFGKPTQGFEVSGQTPLTFTGVQGKNFSSLKAYGMTPVLSHTPSPDNPADIITSSGKLSYEPYSLAFRTDGEQKLEVRGKNLLNDGNIVTLASDMPANLNCVYKGYFGTTDATVHTYYDNTNYRVARAQLKAGTYTWWTDTPNCYTLRYSVDGVVEYYALNTNYYTFTLTEDGEFQMCWRNATTTDFSDEHSMIVEGSVAPTTYEPYIAPKVADIKSILLSADDYEDVVAGKAHNAWAAKVLDGTEEYRDDGGASYIYFSPAVPRVEGGDVSILCTHFRNEDIRKFMTNNLGWHKTTLSTFGVPNTVEGFQAWVAAEYAAGHPVIIIYPLATPTETSITVTSPTQNAGTNTVINTFDNGSLGSAYASSPGDIQLYLPKKDNQFYIIKREV